MFAREVSRTPTMIMNKRRPGIEYMNPKFRATTLENILNVPRHSKQHKSSANSRMYMQIIAELKKNNVVANFVMTDRSSRI